MLTIVIDFIRIILHVVGEDRIAKNIVYNFQGISPDEIDRVSSRVSISVDGSTFPSRGDW